MTKKASIAIICLVCIIGTISLPAKASEPVISESVAASVQSIIQFKNGDCLIKTSPTIVSAQRGSITGHVIYEYANSNGVVLWTATLTGTFTYNGTTAYCTAASCVTSVQQGNWHETYNHAYPSGNTAQADITMVRKVLFVTVQTETAHLVLSCDANGNLS